MSDFIQYLDFSIIEVFSLGVVVASNLLLGVIVYLGDRKSVTNRIFLLLAISIIFWATFNTIATVVTDLSLLVWIQRLAIFFAVPFAMFFFLLVSSFPHKKLQISKNFLYLIFGLAIVTMIINLSPLTFKSVYVTAKSSVPQPEIGPGIFLFAFTSIFFNIGGIIWLIKKRIKEKIREQQVQQNLLIIGFIIMMFFILVFNFVFPAFLEDTAFTPLGALFTTPFIILTAYTIIRHRLLGIKVISTEVLIFILIVVSFSQIMFADSLSELVVQILIFNGLLFFGILLINGVIKEVRQREKLSELTKQLENQKDMLEDLSSINNHQQRTPLTVIKGGIDLLEHSKLSPKQRQEIYDQMKNRVERMLHTLTEFSVGFSPKYKSVNPVPEKGDLVAAVRMIYDEHFELEQSRQRRDKKYKKLQLEFIQPEPPLPPVWFDKNNTLHIISNLMDNAISYSDTGTVRVSFDKDNDFAIVKIQDNGMGVTAEEKKIIFEKSKRSERAKKRYAFGSGLGLFLARQIAEESNGSLDVESKGIGKGSTFILKLPLYKEQDKKKPVSSDATS